MILITGMPRSSTTFICGVFQELGHRMTPKCWCEMTDAYQSQAKGEFYNVCEPIALARAVSDGVKGKELITEIDTLEQYHQSSFRNIKRGKKIVCKLSQLAFYREEILHFDKVIICVRDIDAWLGSAKHHNTDNWINSGASFLDKYKERIASAKDPLKELGLCWYDESCGLFAYLLKRKKSPLLYRCGNDKSLEFLLKEFGVNDITKHTQLKTWNGVRFG